MKIYTILIITLYQYVYSGTTKQLSNVFVIFDEGQIAPTLIKSKTISDWEAHLPRTVRGRSQITSDSYNEIKNLVRSMKQKNESFFPTSASLYKFNCINTTTSYDAIEQFGKPLSPNPTNGLYQFGRHELDANYECEIRDSMLKLARHKSAPHQSMIRNDEYKDLIKYIKLYTKVDVTDANFLQIVSELRAEKTEMPSEVVDSLMNIIEPFLNQTFRLSMGLFDSPMIHKNIDIGKEIQKSRITPVFNTIYKAISTKKDLGSGGVRLDAYATVSTTIYSILIEFGLDKFANEVDDYFPRPGSSIIFEFYDNFQSFKLIHSTSGLQNDFHDLTNLLGCEEYCEYNVIETVGKRYLDKIFDCTIIDPLLYAIPITPKTTTSNDSSNATSRTEESRDLCSCSSDNRPSYCHECKWYEVHALAILVILGVVILLCIMFGVWYCFVLKPANEKKLGNLEGEIKKMEDNKKTLVNDIKTVEAAKKAAGEQQAKNAQVGNANDAKNTVVDNKLRKDEALLAQTTNKVIAKEKMNRAATIMNIMKKDSIAMFSAFDVYYFAKYGGKNTFVGATANKDKIRNPNCAVYDQGRVKLKISGEPDFINACFFKGNGKDKWFISTQGPMENTKDAFWAMVWQEDSKVLIQLGLDNEIENDKIASHFCKYLPTAGSTESYQYGRNLYKVSRSVETDYLDFWGIKHSKLDITCNEEKKKEVDFYHWSDWYSNRGPSVLSAAQKVLDIVMATTAPITVLCSNGGPSSGALISFCALYVGLDKPMTEISLQQILKDVRAQIAHSVGSRAEFNWIYRALVSCHVKDQDIQYLLHTKNIDQPFLAAEEWENNIKRSAHVEREHKIGVKVNEEKNAAPKTEDGLSRAEKSEDESKKTKAKSGKKIVKEERTPMVEEATKNEDKAGPSKK